MPSKKTKLLFIENDKENQKVIKAAFQKKTYSIVITESISDARKAIKSKSIDIIISNYFIEDDTIPDMFPYAENIPIIVISDLKNYEYLLFALDAGAYDIVIRDNEFNYIKVLPYTIENIIKVKKSTDFVRDKYLEELRYLDLVQNLPDIVYKINTEGIFSFVNYSIRMLGYEPEDLIGNHYKMIVHPDDYKLISRDNVIKAYSEKSSILMETAKLFDERRRGSRKTTGLEVRLIPKNWKPGFQDSTVVIGNVTAFGEISSQGYYKGDYESFLGTVGIIRDITNKRKAEALLRKLYTSIEQSPVSEIITDREGNIEYVNPVFLHQVNLKPTEVIGRSIDILEIDSFEKSEYKCIKEIIDARAEWRGEIFSKTENPLWESIVVTPIQNPNGDIENYIIVKLDITKQKLVQKELQEAHDELDRRVKERTAELQKANTELQVEIGERKRFEYALKQSQKMQTIGTLAGGIAHDFNNILTAIFGYANIAKRNIGKKKRVKFNIEQITIAANRAKEIVEQILIFSNRVEKKQISVHLGLVIKEVIKLINVTIPDTIKINEKIKTDSECILADPSQIFQVLMNLCTNSFHAMMQTGGVLEITLESVIVDSMLLKKSTNLHEGKYLRLEVKDTGCGMEKQVLERIFEPFYTTKKITEGTGLGLSVVHGIIISHKGDIFIESEPGKGTKVIIYLPQKNGDCEPIKNNKPDILTGNERILFVDDMQIAFIVEDIFDELGYEATLYYDSVKAFEYFRENSESFDLIITDQSMPGITGLELAKEVFKINSNIPIILTTGFGKKSILKQAKKIGIKDIILKPFTTVELGKIIRDVLDGKK